MTEHKSHLAARRVEPVELPNGQTAYVRTLTLAELREVGRRVAEAPPAEVAHTGLVVGFIAVACDPAGQPLYQFTDTAAVEALPVEAVKAVEAAGAMLNGFTEEAVAAGKSDSPATPN